MTTQVTLEFTNIFVNISGLLKRSAYYAALLDARSIVKSNNPRICPFKGSSSLPRKQIVSLSCVLISLFSHCFLSARLREELIIQVLILDFIQHDGLINTHYAARIILVDDVKRFRQGNCYLSELLLFGTAIFFNYLFQNLRGRDVRKFFYARYLKVLQVAQIVIGQRSKAFYQSLHTSAVDDRFFAISNSSITLSLALTSFNLATQLGEITLLN